VLDASVSKDLVLRINFHRYGKVFRKDIPEESHYGDKDPYNNHLINKN
jgi:hypothetical protein